MNNLISNRLIQVSFFAGIVYYITTYPVVFSVARKYFPIKFKQNNYILIFQTFVFSVLMYILTYFIFNPLLQIVEGIGGQDSDIEDQDSGIEDQGDIEVRTVSDDPNAPTNCAEHFNNKWDKDKQICNYEMSDGSTFNVNFKCSNPKKTPSLGDDRTTLVCT